MAGVVVRVREAIRTRHYSRRTEKAYVAWIRRYILFHGKRHPSEMGAAELTQYLSSLAVQGNVAASTQNQALSAPLFPYRALLEQDLPGLDGVVRAGRPAGLPAVLTRDEVRAVIRQLRGTIAGPDPVRQRSTACREQWYRRWTVPTSRP